MGLNKQKGNMYGFVTHTWNTIKGQCIHDCSYCYMKTWGTQRPIRFDNKEFKTDLGKDNFIFVGSSNDLFAENINNEWTKKTIEHCKKFDNTYLFQSKNPENFKSFDFPENTILCTTLESNRNYQISIAPSIGNRIENFKLIKGYKKMITIEPILDFDFIQFRDILEKIKPYMIAIGANTSKKCNLKHIEPPKFKIEALINDLKMQGINIFIKDNLKRLLK